MHPIHPLRQPLLGLGLALVACIALAQPLAAQAQAYPSKPIRIIVPFGPGGSGDIMARTFAQYLESQTKQSVVVENKPGANGIIGTELAKNAAPDGYTLMLATNSTLPRRSRR